MIKKFTLLTLLLIGIRSSDLIAQIRTELIADLIPSELKTNANAVIRNEEISIEVKELNHVVYKRKAVITILNSAGERHGIIYVTYDKSMDIRSIKGALYNKAGGLITKIPESKFTDESNISGYSLYEDNRVKYFSPTYIEYPYSIELEYEIKCKNSLSLGEWSPQEIQRVSVEKSKYSFTCKNDFPIRIKEYNFTGNKKESLLPKNLKSYEWEATNLKAYRPESFSPPIEYFLPIVKIAPVYFEYEGIKGSFSNWEEYGKWMYEKLLKGRETLPPEAVSRVNEMVKNIASTKEKAKKIYEYVQSKTRYVSIQKGIGGIQPMRAEDVDRLGYGDCKALSNYTGALLKVAGIQSHYVELFAGERIQDVSEDYASLQGNHVILCVPFENDTIWLECTNQNTPFGYLGSFTDGRKAILCTESGGIIVRTKGYTPIENSQIRRSYFKVSEEGHAEGRTETSFRGIQYENRDEILKLSGRKKNEEIMELYPLNNLSIQRFEVKQTKLDTPVTIEELQFIAYNYGIKSNDRMFLVINQLNQFKHSLVDVEERTKPIWIDRGYYDEDLFEYILPANYKIELLPKDIEVKNEFGYFSCKVIVEGNKLSYKRKLLINKGVYPATQYENLKSYFQKISSFDRQKLVLTKINSE